MVKIKFKDGSEISAELNGNCYIVNTKPLFPKDLSIVTIEGENINIVYKNAYIQECASIDNRYWFAFIEMSELEIWKASIEDALCELSIEEE